MPQDSFEKVDSYFTTHKAPTALILNKVDSDLLYLTKYADQQKYYYHQM